MQQDRHQPSKQKVSCPNNVRRAQSLGGLQILAIRNALKRLGVNWHRAKHWISSPNPQYALKKSSGTG
jgi:hypothetical protein